MLGGSASYAQSGHPFITNFRLARTIVDNQNWDICQADDEVMLFANRRGVLAYDGETWNLISTPDMPRRLHQHPTDGRTFISMRKGFGYLEANAVGQYHFVSLGDNESPEGNADFTQIEVIGEQVFFCSAEAIETLPLDAESEQSSLSSPPGEPFTGFIVHGDHLYVNMMGTGLHRLDKNRLMPLPSGDFTAELEIIFHLPFDHGATLIGTDDNAMYIFDGTNFEPVEIEAQDYLDENVLAGGITLDRNLFAVSTLTGGCILIRKSDGKTIFTVNYQNGLPDDEIYAMGRDRFEGLWVAHEFGISRIDYRLPVRRFDLYPGLDGNLIALTRFDSTLFVSSSEGLYRLEEVRDYAAIEVLVQGMQEEQRVMPEPVTQEIFPNNGGDEPGTSMPNDSLDAEDPQSLTWREKRQRNRSERQMRRDNRRAKRAEEKEATQTAEQLLGRIDSVSHGVAPAIGNTPGSDNPGSMMPATLETKREVVYMLQSVSHVFTPIEGLEKKCKQLLEFEDRLLVATNTGLYEYFNGEVFEIAPGQYINFLRASQVKNRIYVGTADGMFTIVFEAGAWTVHDRFDGIYGAVWSIAEETEHLIWIGSENVAYRARLDQNGVPVSRIDRYEFESEFPEKVVVRKMFGLTLFFVSSGIFEYDEEQDRVTYSPELNRNFRPNSRYLFSQHDITWIFDTRSWISLHDHAGINPARVAYLELFDNIQNIFVDEDDNIWVVDQNNALYKILAHHDEDVNSSFNVYIRGVLQRDSSWLAPENIELDFEHNSLEFNLAAPFYLKSEAVEYQYFVEGLTSDWSRWSDMSSVSLPFIPSGNYTLRVRARNVLGSISEEKSLNFKVTPPFWESTWFKIACIIAGGILLWLFMKLRERGLRRQRKVLEVKVQDRTVELAEQKERVEELLLNILPKSIAEELKSKGKATPRQYHTSSVLFTDFKGFTKIAELTEPEELVQELDEHFVAFDTIMEKWGVEKIKTVGDAYMAASGLPELNEHHAILTVLAALEMRQFMEQRIAARQKEGRTYWELRLGVNTGPLVAGVVGKNKFAYDIWGDTVNTAARLEASSEAGKINISEGTYALVSTFFQCTKRGKIEAKNKGPIDMYFVDRIRPEFAADQDGYLPNPKFLGHLDLQ